MAGCPQNRSLLTDDIMYSGTLQDKLVMIFKFHCHIYRDWLISVNIRLDNTGLLVKENLDINTLYQYLITLLALIKRGDILFHCKPAMCHCCLSLLWLGHPANSSHYWFASVYTSVQEAVIYVKHHLREAKTFSCAQITELFFSTTVSILM